MSAGSCDILKAASVVKDTNHPSLVSVVHAKCHRRQTMGGRESSYSRADIRRWRARQYSGRFRNRLLVAYQSAGDNRPLPVTIEFNAKTLKISRTRFAPSRDEGQSKFVSHEKCL